MIYSFHIKQKPVSVNKMRFCRGKKQVLTDEYRAFKLAVQTELAFCGGMDAKKCISLTTERPRRKYGLIIRMKKHANADYGNYIKAIEDSLCKANVTPDDRFAAFAPIIVPYDAPDVGFYVDVMFGEYLMDFENKLKILIDSP